MSVQTVSGIRFNYLLGGTSLIGLNVLANVEFKVVLMAGLALLGLALYVAEGWAFLFKMNRISTRYYFDLTGGSTSKFVVNKEPGCIIWYAFFVRMILRIVLVVVSLLTLAGNPQNELPIWGGIIMGAVVLVELFFTLYVMFESQIFKTSKEEIVSESEQNWRRKNFRLLTDLQLIRKEKVANIILFISALAINMTFWNTMNSDFMDFIHDSYVSGESGWLISFVILLSAFLLCLIMLVPVKLANWVEESIRVKNDQEQRKLRWSIAFSGIATISPTLIELTKVYVFNMVA